MAESRAKRRRLAPNWLRRQAPMIAALLATVVCMAVYTGHKRGLLTINSLNSWELATIDARFRVRGQRPPRTDDIVIVGLDDNTRKERPELFQTRRGWAELIDGLASYHPSLIAIDAFFQNPELNLSPEVVQKVRIARDRLSTLPQPSAPVTTAKKALSAVLEEAAGDHALAAAIGRAENLLIAIMFGLEGKPSTAAAIEPTSIASARFGEAIRIDAPPSRSPPRASWVAATLPLIAEHQDGSGFVNVIPDTDGRVRRMPLVIDRGGRFYMSLALAAYTMTVGQHASYLTGDTQLGVGDHSLSVDRRGRALISFLGPSAGTTFPHYSAADVANKTISSDKLAGKIVFIGYTDSARDKVATPFDSTFDGVELHATLAHNILFDELLHESGPWFTIVCIGALGLLLTLLLHSRVRQRGSWIAAAVGVALLGGYLIISQGLFARGLIIDVVAPMGSIVVVLLAGISVSVATEGREKARLRTVFSQYVQDTLVDRILADPSRARLGGVRRELTVLFSDIRGFSRFSESLEPEQLSSFLNEYLTPMTEVVMDAGGMLDKYIGDAIMAVYGAPLELADHPMRACDTALRMQAALKPLNRDWAKRGLPEIHIGIGINSGPMSVGNMGSEARFDYTVLGDAVNLGARLEALTKEVGADILCGSRTAELAAGKYVFRELGSVRVKGRDAPARIFELVGQAGSTPIAADDLTLYAQALEALRERDWSRAETTAREFATRYPKDRAVATMLERIDALRANPPADNWDGSFEQRSK